MTKSLTTEQIARFPEYVERWTAIGLSTAPADRPAAERAINGIYKNHGLAPLSRIMWCESPQAFMMAIKNKKNHQDNVYQNVYQNVWENVGQNVLQNVWQNVSQNVWQNVWENVLDNVSQNVLHNVYQNVYQNVWQNVWDNVRHNVGQHDLSPYQIASLAFYQYCHDVLGMTDETKHLSDFWELAQTAGGVAFFKDVCFVVERPNILKLDTRGRLHCETGPAMAYPDRWGIYAINGVIIPAWIMEQPDRLSIKAIDQERNSEIQRIMIERFGWERYASDRH